MDLVPPLKDRTLRLSRDGAFFEYRYQTCVSKFWGACTRKEWTLDRYDLNDAEIRKTLIDMGFVAQVREPVN